MLKGISITGTPFQRKLRFEKKRARSNNISKTKNILKYQAIHKYKTIVKRFDEIQEKKKEMIDNRINKLKEKRILLNWLKPKAIGYKLNKESHYFVLALYFFAIAIKYKK